MTSKTFELNELVQLIKNAVKPYLIDARAGDNYNSSRPELPYFPSENINNQLNEVLRDLLTNQPLWSFKTFMALVCGFRHSSVWGETDTIQIPDPEKPNRSSGVNVYSGTKHYLLRELPNAGTLKAEQYRRSYVLIKNDSTLFLVDYPYNLTPIPVNSHKLKALIKGMGEPDESRPLQQTLPNNSFLLDKLSELISSYRFDETIKEISRLYYVWTKKTMTKLGKKSIPAKRPGDWLRIIEKDNEINPKINDVFKKLIVYNYLGLEEKLVEGLDRGAPLNKDLAVRYLTKGLGEDVSPQQVLDLARQHNTFNAYVLAGKFQISSKLPSMRHIDAGISEGWLTWENKYHFKGLISLLKDDSSSPHQKHNHTVEHLSQGNKIQVKREIPFHYRISLSEYATRGDAILQMKPGDTEITADDLLFVESELADFIIQSKENSSSAANDTKSITPETLQQKNIAEEIGQKTKFTMTAEAQEGTNPNKPAVKNDKIIFIRKNKGVWSIEYGTSKEYKHTKGLAYLAYLTSKPNKRISPHDLYNHLNPSVPLDNGHMAPESLEQEGLFIRDVKFNQDINDRKAINHYKTEIKKLDEDIEEAREIGDSENVAKLEEARDFIARELSSNTGYKGKPKTFNKGQSSPIKKIKKAIKDIAYKAIESQQPEAYRHLEQTIILCSDFCLYSCEK